MRERRLLRGRGRRTQAVERACSRVRLVFGAGPPTGVAVKITICIRLFRGSLKPCFETLWRRHVRRRGSSLVGFRAGPPFIHVSTPHGPKRWTLIISRKRVSTFTVLERNPRVQSPKIGARANEVSRINGDGGRPRGRPATTQHGRPPEELRQRAECHCSRRTNQASAAR